MIWSAQLLWRTLFKDVITRLERQKASIERALAALNEVESDDAGEEVRVPSSPTTKAKRKGRKKVSAASRQRMAEAQRQRWAAKKAGDTNVAKKAIRKAAVKKATSNP